MANETTETVEAPKNRQVATTISGELYARLDNHRWNARIEKFSDLQRIALEEYADNHGL